MTTSNINFLVNPVHIVIYPLPLVNSLGPSVGSAGQLEHKKMKEALALAAIYSLNPQ
jgi:hypothetical protein